MNLERYDLVRRIAGPRAFSQWVFLPILVILSAGTSLWQLRSDIATFSAWNSIAVVALLGAWAFASIAGVIVNAVGRQPSVSRFVAVLAVFFITEAGRAVLVAVQAAQLGLDLHPNWPYRVVGGGLTGLALFGVVAYLLNETEEYRTTLGQLTDAKLQLAETVQATESDLEVRRAKMLEGVRSAVTDAIRGVLSTGGASARDVADELVRVSEEVVRPLSHSLFPADEPSIPRVVADPPRISFRSVMHYATYVNPFRPEVVTGFAVLLIAGAGIFATPFEGKVAFLALLVWVFGYLWLMRRFLGPRLSRVPFGGRIAILVVVYLGLAVMPSALVSVAMSGSGASQLPYFLYIVFIGQVCLWPLAVIAGVRAARDDVIEDTRMSNERLDWSRARLSSYLWGQQSNLAVALHKDVQGTLMAAAMKLKMSRDAGKDDAKAIDDIRSTVLEAAEFATAPSEAPAFVACVDDVNRRWQGVFRVALEAGSEPAIARVDHDVVCRRILADLLAEFVTNAVKHGQATSAQVSLQLVGDDVVRITGINNGRSLVESPGAGLGTRMVAAVSLDQGLGSVPGGVRVWADIPVV